MAPDDAPDHREADPPLPSAELVDLYDADGRVSGTATRARVRAENLRHAATMILVRDPRGRVFVHRRTDTKDVFPGLWDFCAGGVVAAGEAPRDAAARELAEELGVVAPLRSLGTGSYSDSHADYVAFCFEVTHDGPVRLQPEEVAEGDWWDVTDLQARLDAAPESFVPDSRALMRRYL